MKKQVTKADWADSDDAPELDDAFFQGADEYVGEALIRRGRPKAAHTKQAVTVRYDAEVVDAFRSTGKGWQTRMNGALRDWLKTHKSTV